MQKPNSKRTKIAKFSNSGVFRMTGKEARKYSNFEGSKNTGNSRFYRHLSSKKTFQKNAIFGNSSFRKSGKLMQNVKNQFLH